MEIREAPAVKVEPLNSLSPISFHFQFQRGTVLISLILLLVGMPCWAGVTVDVSVNQDLSQASMQITTPSFSTSSPNELVLAFIASDGLSSPMIVSNVSGAGLAWIPVARVNTTGGTSEIWRAFAVAPVANVTVTATLAQKVFASIQVVSFSGVDTTGMNGAGAIGAVATTSGSGAPSASLVTTRANSLVFGVGNDYNNAKSRTVGTGQTLIHQDLSTTNNDTYWVQRQTNPISAVGSNVKINDTAPTSDHFNLAICEILSPSGTITPSITGLSPSSGVAGTSVMISGTNFGSSPGNGSVTFGGVYAPIVNWTTSSITALVPYGASTGNVVVAASDGVSSNGASFTVNGPAAGLAIDAYARGDATSPGTQLSTSAFSTSSANELLLAFIATDALSAGMKVNSVSGGGLTWVLVKRGNQQLGDTEIWRAFARSPLSNATVTATLAQSVVGSLEVLSFTGADASGTNGSGAIGATSGGNANPGAPTASLATTRAGSWVFGVGNDYDKSISRTLGAGQALLHQFWSPTNDTYWMQRLDNTTPASGTSVTINDVAPAADRYNLSLVEVLPSVSNAPVISSVSPNSDPVGATVNITGSNFGSTQGASTLTFGGVAASPTTWTAQQITVPVPVGAAIGSDPVVVTTAPGVSNSAAFTVVPPLVVIASSSPAPNTNGWNNTNVTISYQCSGGVLPVQCPGSQIVTSEGFQQAFNATAIDANGNLAAVITKVSIDKTAPTISATITPAPNAQGVVTAPAAINFTCSDALSGTNICPTTIQITATGLNQIFSGTATDKAGNSATANLTLSVQSSPLSITASLSVAANSTGWNNTPVTLTYQCGGGVAPTQCPGPKTVSSEGAQQVITATTTDAAGQSASVSTTLNIDVTPPVVTATSSPTPNSAGWNNTDVTVSFICTDSLSGIAICPQQQVVTSEGAAQAISGTATDNAGNSSSANVTLSIDKTPPVISVISPTDGSNINNPQATIQGLVSDTPSGVNTVACNGNSGIITGTGFSCSIPLTTGSNTVTISASDVAGNNSTFGLTLRNVIPINVHITTPTPLQLFSANPITVSGTVDHPNASVTVGAVTAVTNNGSFTASGVNLRESKNLLTASATSPDGGVGSDTVTVFLDTTPPTVHIDTPADGATVTTAQIDVSGNVNDVVTGTVNGDQVVVNVNGVNAAVANRSFAAHGVLLVPGANTITAAATDRAGNLNQHQVRVTLQPLGNQQTLLLVSGNNQQAQIRTVLPQPLVVQATDALGRPMPRVLLTFAIVKSDGIIFSGQQRGRALSIETDVNGNASVLFQTGSRNGEGVNQVAVTAPGFVGQLVFSADSTVSAASQIHPVSGDMQTGAVGIAVAEPLVAIVLDAGGNPVANVPVTFTVQSGGGLIDDQISAVNSTDGDGKAFAVLVLGTQAGINTNVVTASIVGMIGGPAVFTSSGVIPGLVANTTVSGIVLDDANMPILNATASIKGTNLSALTNASGRFTIMKAPVGDIVLFVDGSTSTDSDTYPTLSFQMVTIPGIDNSLPGPIYLPALDTDNSQIAGGDQDVILTMKNVPGVAYRVFANSATFPDGTHVGRLTLSQVHADKVPMTPPNGQGSRLVGTLQPAGVRFNPPIQMTLPNTDGLAPGTVVEAFSFHHEVEQFVVEGTARVSEDGSVLVTDPGFGLTVSGWHAFAPAPQKKKCVGKTPPCQKCDTSTGTFVTDSAQEGKSCGSNSCTKDVCKVGKCEVGDPTTNTSGSDADKQTWKNLMSNCEKVSKTLKNICKDPGFGSVNVNLGRGQAGVTLDDFSTNQVNLDDLQATDSKRCAWSTDSCENMIHFLKERLDGGSGFATAHQHGIDSENAYRQERGFPGTLIDSVACPGGGCFNYNDRVEKWTLDANGHITNIACTVNHP